jgi:hypothetical protein
VDLQELCSINCAGAHIGCVVCCLLVCCLARLLACLLVRLLACLLACSLARSFAVSLARLLSCSFACFLARSFACSLACLFVCSFFCMYELCIRLLWVFTYCGRPINNLLFFLNIRSEVSMPVTIKSVVFWDVTPCDYCKNPRFGGT